MNPATVLVDGVPGESVCVFDRGFAFGDGVFRTLAVRGGRPLNWRWHMRRLEADCRALLLAVPREATLLEEIARVAPGDAVAKVVVTRGRAERGYAIAGSRPTRVVAAFPAATDASARALEGVQVRRCALVLSEQPRLAGAKTLNRLENVLARSEWDDPGISEGLLADARGHVIEGTMSNLFVVREGRFATPDLSRCGVVGAQRERVRELLGAEGAHCVVRELSWEDLARADEVFLTNSLIGIWPVVRMQAHDWPAGPWTRRLQELVARDDARA